MSWTVTGRGVTTPLLDLYPGAAAAYSLRQLTTGTERNVVRVRRSSDNAEQDFTAAQVTDGTLTTFCGAGDGFVRTWYDQSGNGRNAIQPTSGSQPKIVSSGALVTHNSKPAIDTDGAKTLYNAASGLNTGAALVSFAAYSTPVAAAADTQTMALFSVGINPDPSFFYFSSSGVSGFVGEYIALDVRTSSGGQSSTNRIGSTTYRRNSNTLVIESAQLLSSGTKIFQNNIETSINIFGGEGSITANYTPNAVTRDPALTIGGLPSTAIDNIIISASMKISEFIAYNTDQSSVRSAITTAMNSQYAAF